MIPSLVGESLCLAMPRPTRHAPRANGELVNGELVKVGKGFGDGKCHSESPSIGERLVKDALSPPKISIRLIFYDAILRYADEGEL